MKNEQQQQAKHLYFQTNLSKTQIAELINMSRRSVHYWIQEGNWDRLKKSATHLPALLAENCYHIIGHFTRHILSEHRIMKPVNSKEADILYKLTLAVNKLKNRSTLNESMEMFAFFLEGLKKKEPKLADEIMPHVDDYLSSRAGIFTHHLQPASFNEHGLITEEKEELLETQLDMQDLFEWQKEGPESVDGQQSHANEICNNPVAVTQDSEQANEVPATEIAELVPATEVDEKNSAAQSVDQPKKLLKSRFSPKTAEEFYNDPELYDKEIGYAFHNGITAKEKAWRAEVMATAEEFIRKYQSQNANGTNT